MPYDELDYKMSILNTIKVSPNIDRNVRGDRYECTVIFTGDHLEALKFLSKNLDYPIETIIWGIVDFLLKEQLDGIALEEKRDQLLAKLGKSKEVGF